MQLASLVQEEIERQDESWGDQAYVPNDRWMEIVTDEFNDLRWAVRIRWTEKDDHDIDHELVQTIATMFRWLRARTPLDEGSG